MKSRQRQRTTLGAIPCAALALAAALWWSGGAAETQTPTGLIPVTPRPAVSPHAAVILATEVLRVADVIAQSLARTSRIPGAVAVTLSDGSRQTLSPAQLFVVLTRFLGNGYEAGVTPDYAPTPPAMIAPLEYGPPAGIAQATVVATTDLLAQTRATADVAESTGHLPSAVWVVGQRLSPAQFMGALATVLQHALYHGQIPEQVRIGAYLPPLDWAEAAPTPSPNAGPLAAIAAPALGTEQPVREGSASAPAVTANAAQAEPPAAVRPQAADRPPPTRPFIRLWLPTEGKLSGVQPLTIEYQGPAAFTRVAIDGAAKAVSNMRHFTYSWDTRLESDGSHRVQVTAVNASNETLATVETTVETANGNKPLR